MQIGDVAVDLLFVGGVTVVGDDAQAVLALAGLEF